MEKLLLNHNDLILISDIIIPKLQEMNRIDREMKGLLNDKWVSKYKRLHELHNAICDYMDESETHPDRIYQIDVSY